MLKIRPGEILAGFLVVLLALPSSARAQYFGRNKVNYENFDFRILSTQHFDVHFYSHDQEIPGDVGRMAERWYERFSPVFHQEFKAKKPLIIYSDHADFQQTNAISGVLSEGTGGVTESLKNRVVMPLTGDYASTDHVLGHEMVHVFQYDIAFAEDDTIPFRLNALPLWLIEGMAEYLSVGRDDPHTAMWLRDAVLSGEFPTIKQLTTDSRFFPYRFGQALWAYVGGTWGDETIPEIYRYAGKRGLEFAFAKALGGVTTDSLSVMWAKAVKDAYLPTLEGRAKPGEAGKKLLSGDQDAGQMNLAPALSPDGSQVAFLSERDLFSIDVFVADAATGKVKKKLVNSATTGHFDALRFIDTAGTWSPDGKRMALVVFARGNNEVLIVDVASGKIKKRYKAKGGVGSIANPAWSPDGRYIAFSGTKEGRSDLYLFEVESEEITRLTDDRFAQIQPTWSPDGKSLAFVTDQDPRTQFEILRYASLRLGVIDVASRQIRTYVPFEGAKHINPQYSPDGRSLYFISDPEGFSDIFRIDLDTEEISQVTRVATGVSGITAVSPAMSVAPSTGRLLFSVFEDGKYVVYGLEPEQAKGEPLRSSTMPLASAGLDSAGTGMTATPGPGGVRLGSGTDTPGTPGAIRRMETHSTVGGRAAADTTAWGSVVDSTARGAVGSVVDSTARGAVGSVADTSATGAGATSIASTRAAGILPPAEDQGRVLVTDYLSDPEGGLVSEQDFSLRRYKPKLQLDYIGGFAAGGVTSNQFGTGVAGGATAYFSDMLGNHTLGVGIQANGGFKDIGAQVFYLNRKRRYNWGGSLGHIPYLNIFNSSFYKGDTLVVEELHERVFLDQASLFTTYPLSVTKRLEFGGGVTLYSYDREVVTQALLPNGIVTDPITLDAPAGESLLLFQASAAVVGDGSFHAFTSPVQGYRYRIEVEPTFGSLSYVSLLVDYRKYFLLRPVTLALRGMHLGRYGGDSEDPRLSPLYLGYATLVRGYSSYSFDPLEECTALNENNCFEFDRLVGSRILVTNVELRYPLFGNEDLGLVNFPYLPTEIAGFVDGGVAWTSKGAFDLRWETNEQALGTADRVPVFSAGGCARVNLLGAIILEGYVAFPFQRPNKGSVWGVQIVSGW